MEKNRIAPNVLVYDAHPDYITTQLAFKLSEISVLAKSTIVVFSGDLDKVYAAFIIATTAASMGKEVTMFFTFWGLNLIKQKRGRSFIGKGFMARVFNFLMGGRNNHLQEVIGKYPT